ncbi:hypothetical protein CAEBREN_02101 [Caenorhabditis brenneri]|uniref:Uncharacterized protein n=1 Tax=Caenorhabditis brenneri TaxID=135651 RepID=G0MPL6_CAEBE|nr:hypothetical protein CAEBREN_02101 [Caenorhabditis brenneri]
MEVTKGQHLLSEFPTSAVLNNIDLVAKILEKVTDDIRNNMELRLVNRTFSDACHANLRKNHRNLKIEYIFGKTENQETQVITNNQVYINCRCFPVLNVYSYFLNFSFLKNIAKVKIQSIVAKGLWQLRPCLQVFLHESIRLSLIKNGGEFLRGRCKTTMNLNNFEGDSIKKLIEMKEICHGNCEACLWIPNGCVEYGPLHIENLRRLFIKPRVFEKLIVSDDLLDDIANFCVESTNTKNDCLKAISNFIPSNISCTTLILKISETRQEWIAPDRNDIQEGQRMEDHQAMPREVIEFMLKQWKVQSVILKFVHKDHRNDYKGEWTQKNWFTILHFKGSCVHIEKSDRSLKIKEVLLDLTDSIECKRGLISALPNFHSYFDASSIIRRVFRNDKLKIQFAHYNPGGWLRLFRTITYIMGKLNAEAPRNLEVELNIYLEYKDDTEFLDELINQEPHLRPAVYKDFHIFNHPNAISVFHKTVNCKDHPSHPIINKEWIGKCCQMINKEKNYTIKWTFFTNEDSIDRNIPN